MPGLLTAWLRDDEDLLDYVSGAIYCDRFPDGHTGVGVLVRGVNVLPTVAPTLAFDTYVVQVDVEGEDGGEAAMTDLVDMVRSRLHAARGVHDVGVVNSVTVGPTVPGVTAPDSPALPRWVLTVDVTGRSN